MSKSVLLTGGAGFIGSHVVDRLIMENKYEITVLDILEPQVHGDKATVPAYLNPEAEFIQGSVEDYELMDDLIQNNDILIHLAAMVGVGQSMYQIKKYVRHNTYGTSVLLDILSNKKHSVQKVVIASSNTIYGEGKYNCVQCGVKYPDFREKPQLKEKDWELKCPDCGKKMDPLPTDETTPFNSSSIYALTKQNQEQMGLMIGKTYGIDTTILRFFLVYGPRQSLSNPYTGVCAIFSSRLLNNQAPLVFEDGLQSRDFVHVNDIAQAILLSIKKKKAKHQIYNVGSGESISIKNVAETLAEKINPKVKPIYNEQYRVGDIRHCVADISKIKNHLGYQPKVRFQDGIEDLIHWIRKKTSNNKSNSSQRAIDELQDKGLIK
ncbi:MAG: NAD-dependent epimerase/dehydratase family protein [Candidatus Lokiarchaeota archaeon]|nr:NAD-dependent epimerase/dehydratase family protein [Candidatus Lokiarchaeota archaeon]MBD3201331.1 NAD-dependent epimerase/dehydratase family protein [Candidatus Lokiarchaeota archaeon]